MSSFPTRIKDLLGRMLPLPWQMSRAPLSLRKCQRVGIGTRVVGRRPLIDNEGTIEIGRGAMLASEWAPVQLRTIETGRIVLDDLAKVNYGASITSISEVRIGRDAKVGPFCVVDDRIFDGATTSGRPIVLEDDCWLANRVVVLPGSVVGAGAVVAAGSVVDGEIPPRTLAAGSPAKVIRHFDGTEAG